MPTCAYCCELGVSNGELGGKNGDVCGNDGAGAIVVVVVVKGGVVVGTAVVVEGVLVVVVGVVVVAVVVVAVVVGAAVVVGTVVVVSGMGVVGAIVVVVRDSMMNVCNMLIVLTSPASVFIRRSRSILIKLELLFFRNICVRSGRLLIIRFCSAVGKGSLDFPTWTTGFWRASSSTSCIKLVNTDVVVSTVLLSIDRAAAVSPNVLACFFIHVVINASPPRLIDGECVDIWSASVVCL